MRSTDAYCCLPLRCEWFVMQCHCGNSLLKHICIRTVWALLRNEIFELRPRPNNYSSLGCFYISVFYQDLQEILMLPTGLQQLSPCYFHRHGKSSRLAPTELLHLPTEKLFWEIWGCKEARKQNSSLNHLIKGVGIQKLKGFSRWFINIVFLKKLSLHTRTQLISPV